LKSLYIKNGLEIRENFVENFWYIKSSLQFVFAVLTFGRYDRNWTFPMPLK